jgi:4-amino-4-deoxy-L-arabinose transferase-like glycosyltransferase
MPEPTMPSLARLDALLAAFAGALRPLALPGLLALSLLLFLPGFLTLPPIDRDEARFAQATKQMVASGDYIDIRLQEAPRYKKPVGIYWLQAAAVQAVGQDGAIWVYRLPALIGALAAIALTYLIARLAAPPGIAFAAGLFLALTVLIGAEARLAKTDAVLLATILAAQWVLARLWIGWRTAGTARLPAWAAYGFWVALAAAVLVKGPVGPMVVGLTALALALIARRAGWLAALRPWPGFLLFLVLVIPWYAAITGRAGALFWAESLGRDLFGKVREAQESHGAPPGSYLLLAWLLFWPGAAVLAAGAGAIWRLRTAPMVGFAAAWVIPAWAIFEAVPTKLPHYVLPLYPALAILAALVWDRALPLLGRGWGRVLLGLSFLTPAILIGGLAGAAWQFEGRVFWQSLAAVAIALPAGWLLWRAAGQGARHAGLVALAMLALASALGSFPVLARIGHVWPSVALAAQARAAPCPDPLLIGAGYHEPSLVFLTRTDILYASPDAAGAAFAEAACAVAFVAAPAHAAFAGAAGPLPDPAGHVVGFNLGAGRDFDLAVFVKGD